MAFGDEVLANYNLSSSVSIFNDQPTAGWWTFDILIGFTDGHALASAAGILTLDAMTGEPGGAGWSEGGSAETIFKASGKVGVHCTTPLRYFDGTRYATITLLSSNASDTSVEVSVTPRRVEVDTTASSVQGGTGPLFEAIFMELIPVLTGLSWEEFNPETFPGIPASVWAETVRTLSAGAITENTFDSATAYPLTKADGLTFAQALTALMAVNLGRTAVNTADPAAVVATFYQRDGETPSAVVTYGETAGERTGVSLP